jgi:hypothetical protein
MTFNLYSLWIDPIFYISVAVFVLFLFLLAYSIRRYRSIENSEQEEPVDIEVLQEQEMEMPVENLEQEFLADEVPEQEQVMETPVGEDDFEKTVIAQPSEMPIEEPILAEQETEDMVEQTPVLQEQVTADLSEAEGFVKGIFNGISDIDERLKAVESTLSERKLNGDFALRYLEDILDEYEGMDKTAVKSRIEYLIADLKK